jgi:hypothetical protein
MTRNVIQSFFEKNITFFVFHFPNEKCVCEHWFFVSFQEHGNRLFCFCIFIITGPTFLFNFFCFVFLVFVSALVCFLARHLHTQSLSYTIEIQLQARTNCVSFFVVVVKHLRESPGEKEREKKIIAFLDFSEINGARATYFWVAINHRIGWVVKYKINFCIIKHEDIHNIFE